MPLKRIERKKQNPLVKAGRPIGEVLEEYRNLSGKIKLFEDRKKELAEVIKDFAVQNGKVDDKGSLYAECGDLVYGRISRKSVTINEERAEKYFRRKKLWSEVSKEVIDRNKLDALIDSGEIDIKDIETFLDTKETFSVLVTEKTDEAMPEVEVGRRSK